VFTRFPLDVRLVTIGLIVSGCVSPADDPLDLIGTRAGDAAGGWSRGGARFADGAALMPVDGAALMPVDVSASAPDAAGVADGTTAPGLDANRVDASAPTSTDAASSRDAPVDRVADVAADRGLPTSATGYWGTCLPGGYVAELGDFCYKYRDVCGSVSNPGAERYQDLVECVPGYRNLSTASKACATASLCQAAVSLDLRFCTAAPLASAGQGPCNLP
jgi:hypothetical protein